MKPKDDKKVERCQLCHQIVFPGGIKMDVTKAINMEELASIIERVKEALAGIRCQACGRKF